MRRPRIGGARAPAAEEAAQVLAALRYRRLHRRAARDRIPAYLVLGPPGMGKSAVLQRSGVRLDRPLELPSSRWWIGEEALFVEVSPRGDDQGDDRGADADGGYPVLPLLRALRPAVPVSGVVLVVSPADLTLADAAERADMSAALAGFLRAFEARFRYAPPLYLVVSKLDLTPGFAEFFDRLEPAEREQPWGFTLPVELGPREDGGPPATGATGLRAADPGPRGETPPAGGGAEAAPKGEPEGVAAAYRTGFRRLLDAIRTRVTQWISPETDPVQCARISGFGAQVAALEAILRPVVEQLLPADDRRWPGAWLRGVYLTSAQQDALAIDVLLPDMAKRFGLPRTGTLPPDLGRDDEALGYFVGGVFRRVILPEAGLAQRGHRGLRAAAARNWSLAAAAVAACAALGFVLALEYREGVGRIALADDAAAAVGPALTAADPGQAARIPPALDALAALREAGGGADPRFVLPLDAYAGALIGRAADGLYDRALATSLAPHLAHRLDRDLVALGAPSQALRAALAAAAADRSDADGAYRRWLGGAAAALPPEAGPGLERHGIEALRIGAAPGVEPAYADAARGALEARGEATR